MGFRGMFGWHGWQKSHLIAFHKCQENLQDRPSVTERLLRKGSVGGLGERTLSTHSKKVTGFTGIVAFSHLTFRSYDDDFNVSDVIMSRICSADNRGVAL